MEASLKVGDLARRTGLSVRTLHHYDEIGLLEPAERTRSGHRLYGRDEVRRLQQIASLRQVGLSLEDIARCLDHPDMSLERTLDLQIERLRDEIERQQRLCRLLEALRARVARSEDPGLDDLTATIEMSLRAERYYTVEQLEWLGRRREEVGDERIQQVQEDWAALFEDYTHAMEAGLDPAAPEVRALAHRSEALIAEFTGGNPGIRASLDRMYRDEGPDQVLGAHGTSMAPGLWDYMARAREILAASRSGATAPAAPTEGGAAPAGS